MNDHSRVAFVTGAASGIGRATAEAFLRAGYRTVYADRDVPTGQRAAEAGRDLGETQFIACDVADDASVAAAVDAAAARWGRIDVAFNGAGIDGDRAPTVDCSVENWQRVIAVNLTGMWYCLRHELRHMLAQGSGAIVNCASITGLVGTVLMPAYAASKHGVVGLTRSAALDVARSGVRVNAVCPGLVDTPMWQRSISPELTAQLLADDPMGRLCQPQEIAETVVFLCSDAASMINGQALAIDGGALLR